MSDISQPNRALIFTILCIIKWASFYLPIAIVARVTLLGYVIYFSASAVFISCKIKNIANYAIPANNRNRKMQSNRCDGGVCGQYNGVKLVDMC